MSLRFSERALEISDTVALLSRLALIYKRYRAEVDWKVYVQRVEDRFRFIHGFSVSE